MDLALAAAAVHVWQLPLDDDMPPVLSPDERARAARCRDANQRRRFVCRRSHLRQILERYTGIPAAELRFHSDAYGRPVLDTGAPAFSLTSSGDLALLAVTREAHVGIDLETVRALPDIDVLIAAYIPPGERAGFASLEPRARVRAFLRRWTIAEASLKARGGGLGLADDATWFAARAPFVRRVDPSRDCVATLASYGKPLDFMGFRILETRSMKVAMCWPSDADG